MTIKEEFKFPEKLIKIEQKPLDLSNFDTKEKDIQSLALGLREDGIVEIKEFSENNKGPYLVVFKENHDDNSVKVDNAMAFIKNKQFFNFLAAEGGEGEVSNSLNLTKGDIKKKIELILLYTNIGPDIIEEVLGDEIYTFGVDLSEKEHSQIGKTINRIDKEINKLGLINNIDLMSIDIEKQLEIKRKKVKHLSQHRVEMVLDKRNTLWLNKISEILKNKNFNMGKNFIPIVCGGNHAEGLSENAGKYGFKGVITFTPKSYNILNIGNIGIEKTGKIIIGN